MNVLFLTTNYPRPESPIDGIFVREHARAAGEIADVRVVHLLRAPAARGLVRLERIEGEEPAAWRVPYRRFGKPLAQLAFVLGPLALARRFRREGWVPDVIHASSFLSALPALLLGRLLRRPVAYTEHWTIFLPENPGSLSRGMERLAGFALEHADVVLPVSEDLDLALRRLAPGARTRVVPNVVDDVFTPADGRPPGDGVRLLTVGLLDTPRKGVDVLLEALALVPGRDRLRLDVVGEGELRPGYEELSERLGQPTRRRVDELGHASHPSRDDRQPARQRLEHDARVVLVPAREHEEVGLPHPLGQRGLRLERVERDRLGEAEPLGELLVAGPELALAHDVEP